MLRKHNWANTAKARAYYISFYNSMWLVANDIIIGLAIGSFLKANHTVMANELHKILHTYTVESIQSMMLWFLESPAGLKLNHELGSFLSELFLWLIGLWTHFAARIFNWQLVILGSLFNLFRGKKRNILRNRIDSCDYDLDQLLLGTSLFTLLTFLFPTVLVYYLTFALGRVGIIFLQAVMETILAFFNHFPLFAIMLRIKDPHRLPGGLKFEIFKHDYFLLEHHNISYKVKQFWVRTKKENKINKRSLKKKMVTFNIPSSNSSSTKHKIPTHTATAEGAYLWMRNMPIPMGAIFFQYMLLWKRLSAHYFSAYVFKCLLYGESIKPIPKLQVMSIFFFFLYCNI
ncbi:N-acetylglucosaminyl transferase component-domain-containing protein [Cokeromyces recurvatus]|uniref:N-acetylglucosaminyl transferase component-domain-containing protein n=1 Tax=Cokeromyces recurvatus TaxID=90255 RepID=UPI002220DE1C|nr:N-acetylglucosaminyl transferase component-domain-containing protein [Cokeromyces recurvatus]KAI7907165.1 N-acetylglucosaminyl transferase component-domain-containing protein [Cokeromyces recurvatus]